MMSRLGERKFWLMYTVLVIVLIIGFVFASGCLDFLKSFGGSKKGTQTTPTPVESPTEDITQVTQALETPGPGSGGAGGSGSGSGGTCCNREMIMPIMKLPQGLRNEWTGWFGGAFQSNFFNSQSFRQGCPNIEFHMAQWELPKELQTYNEYFGTASDSDAEYLWVGTVSVDNIQGKPGWSTGSWGHWCWDDEGNDCDDTPYGDYTFTMKIVDPWHGNTVLKEGSVSWKGGIMDGFSHKEEFYQPSTDSKDVKIVDLIGDFAKQQFMPLDKIVRDYERIPEKCTVKPEKDPVQTGEKMKITLSEFADSEGRLPQPWDRVLVKANKGKILNGVEKDGFRVFEIGGGTIDVEYKAPCDESTETITVYNSCNTYDHPGDPPLSNTNEQKIIVTKTFEVEDKKPVSGQISTAKDNLNPSETIDVTVDNLKDKKGKSPDPAQRILVKADYGQIIGGTAAGKYKVFKVGDSSIKFQYKAPDSCDVTSSDTITVFNSCDIDEQSVPLSNTTPKNQIATKTINLNCEKGLYFDFECNAKFIRINNRSTCPNICEGPCTYVEGQDTSLEEFQIRGKIPFSANITTVKFAEFSTSPLQYNWMSSLKTTLQDRDCQASYSGPLNVSMGISRFNDPSKDWEYFINPLGNGFSGKFDEKDLIFVGMKPGLLESSCSKWNCDAEANGGTAQRMWYEGSYVLSYSEPAACLAGFPLPPLNTFKFSDGYTISRPIPPSSGMTGSVRLTLHFKK